MKKLIIIITVIIVANVICLGPTFCNAQLGEDAPLPEIKKPTGPSLEETMKWITEKVSSLPVMKIGTGWARNEISFDGCDMTHTRIERRDNKPRFEFNRVDLNKLDENAKYMLSIDNLGSSVTNPDLVYTLTLYSIGHLDVFKYLGLTNVSLDDTRILNTFTVTNDTVGPNGDNFYFLMDGKEIAVHRHKIYFLKMSFREKEVVESLKNALVHAIKSCREKAVAEKAAQPAKKKELF